MMMILIIFHHLKTIHSPDMRDYNERVSLFNFFRGNRRLFKNREDYEREVNEQKERLRNNPFGYEISRVYSPFIPRDKHNII